MAVPSQAAAGFGLRPQGPAEPTGESAPVEPIDPEPLTTAAIVDGFYDDSSHPPLNNIALFDSMTASGGTWPCESNAARQNLSQVGAFTRSLDESPGIGLDAGADGCHLINNSVQGTSWYGWAYPFTGNGVADFNADRAGTGDPRNPEICPFGTYATPMGEGKLRIIGEIRKPATGLGFGMSVDLRASAGQCVGNGTIESWPIVSVGGTGSAVTQAFDITVDIPDGTRTVGLTIRGGDPRDTGPNDGVFVRYLRMYASLGADAPDPQPPVPPEQTYGLGSIHSKTFVNYEKDPVNTATGNLAMQAIDLRLPGRGLCPESTFLDSFGLG